AASSGLRSGPDRRPGRRRRRPGPPRPGTPPAPGTRAPRLRRMEPCRHGGLIAPCCQTRPIADAARIASQMTTCSPSAFGAAGSLWRRRGRGPRLAAMTLFDILILAAVGAVAVTLGFGIYALYRGGDFGRSYSNKL